MLSKPASIPSEKSTIIAIHRARLHKVLLACLKMENLLTGKKLSRLTKNDNGYELEFENGTNHQTDYLIAADGIYSAVRNAVLPDSKLRYAGYTCWRGITDNMFNIQKATETWGSSGRFGIVPLADNRVYWFACKKAPEGDERMKAYGSEDLYQLFKNYHHPIGNLIKSTSNEQIIWNDIYDLKPISRYAFENLVLIGDAAHATTPNMGQGACQAIEDALVLAECLQEITSVNEAFQKFEEKRMERTHYIVKQSRTTGKIAQAENKALSAIRNSIIRNIPESILNKQLDKLFEVQFSL